MRLSKQQAVRCREVADNYAREKGLTEYEVGEVADWAIARGDLGISDEEQREIIRARIAEALRTDTVKDDNGLDVRVRHCVEMIRNGAEREPAPRTLWAHIDVARDEFLMESLRQRRQRIGNDVEQLRRDLCFINVRRLDRGLRAIQMSFDFTPEVDGLSEAGGA